MLGYQNELMALIDQMPDFDNTIPKNKLQEYFHEKD